MERRSELLRPAGVVLRHPRLVAVGWFAMFAGAAAALLVAAVVVLFYMEAVQTIWPLLFIMAVASVFGALAAVVPAALLGHRIVLQKNVFSADQAAGIGAGIAFWSTVWPIVTLSFSGAIVALNCGQYSLHDSIGICGGYMGATMVAIIIISVVAQPMGRLGGGLLYKFRERAVRPIGCRVHGYREGGAE